MKAVGTDLLSTLVVIVGLVLLIVPGIVMALGLSQSLWLLADFPDMSPVRAMEESWGLMWGFKWKLLWMNVQFVLLGLLCLLLTLGIGFLWLFPYMQASYAHFYHDVRMAKASENG